MTNRLAALILFLGLLLFTATAEAGAPRYLTLQSQTNSAGRWAGPGYSTPVSRSPYAWGWFGASRHTQSYYHDGYYQGYYRQRTDW